MSGLFVAGQILLRQSAMLAYLVSVGVAVRVDVTSSETKGESRRKRLDLETVFGAAFALVADAPASDQAEYARVHLGALLAFVSAPAVFTGRSLVAVPPDAEGLARKLASYIPANEDPDVIGSTLLGVQAWLAAPSTRDAVFLVAAELKRHLIVPGDRIIKLVTDATRDAVTFH